MKSNFMISVFLLCFSIQLITATTTTTNGKIPDIFLQYADNPDPPPSTDLAKMARYVMHYSGNKYYYTTLLKKAQKSIHTKTTTDQSHKWLICMYSW